MFKPTKLYLIKDDNLEAWVKKEIAKKIFEKKSIFKFSSFKLAIVLKILQKTDHFTQEQ